MEKEKETSMQMKLLGKSLLKLGSRTDSAERWPAGLILGFIRWARNIITGPLFDGLSGHFAAQISETPLLAHFNLFLFLFLKGYSFLGATL